MDENKTSNNLLTLGTDGSASGIKLDPDQDNIMAVGGSGVNLGDGAARDVSPTSNIDAIPNNNRDIKGSENAIQTTTTTGDKNGNSSEGNLDVNNILAEADNAAIAAQTITLSPGTMTEISNTVNSGTNGNSINGSNMSTSSIPNTMAGPGAVVASTASVRAVDNSNSNTVSQNITNNNGMQEMLLGTTKNSNADFQNPVNMSNVNINQYILASAGVPPAPLTNTTMSTTPAAVPHNNLNAASVINPTASPAAVDPNTPNGTANAKINGNQHFQSAILQQNAAIMQQNAATLQHLQNLQQTNKLLATNPEAAATLGMLAPIMNMNLTMANPVQLLATATPSLNLNSTGGVGNVAASTFLPAATALQATTTNLSDINGASTFATAPINTQQQQSIPIPAQLGTIAIAPGASQTFPVAGFTNNINMNNTGITNNSTGIADGGSNNKDAVQNILRTAFMLQNSGLPFLQQGIIPQQQQLIPSPGGGIMLLPNANTNNTPFGVVPAGIPANNINSNSNANETSSGSAGDVGNNGSGSTSGAAAAANAAASVLPPASMNLPLQQKLQQQQQLNPSFTPQMGIDLTSIGSNNNAISLIGGGVLNNNINNGSNINNNSLQIAGLATLQQQQQRIQNMAFPPMNLSESHSQQPKQQQPLLGNTLNTTTTTTATTQLKQQQSQAKQSSISRPLYLDHDSNCLTAYQCFLRKQIELFEVGHDEMTGTAQGRNTPLHYGQVGIRCRHCAHLPKAARARGGVYYSRTIDGVYQVAQNMSKLHFLKACTLIPENTKNQLKSLQSVSSRASGGKEYWAEGLRVLGIVEEGGMLRFSSNSTASSTQISKSTD